MFLWSNIIPSVTLSSIQLNANLKTDVGRKDWKARNTNLRAFYVFYFAFTLLQSSFFVAPLAAISYQTSVHGVTVNSYGSYLFFVFVSS